MNTVWGMLNIAEGHIEITWRIIRSTVRLFSTIVLQYKINGFVNQLPTFITLT